MRRIVIRKRIRDEFFRMKLPVNLATKPMETHRPFLTVCGTLIALLALPFPWLAWHTYSVRKADAAFRAQSEAAKREIDTLIKQREDLTRFFSQPENARLHDRAGFINAIIDAQSLNWTRMFHGLEQVLPDGVRVLNIEPRLEGGQASMKLTVGAMTEDAKRNFLSELEHSGDFTNVQLMNVRISGAGESGDPIVMELTVTYLGAA
jgi:Tfp pilus assembly protein PilN